MSSFVLVDTVRGLGHAPRSPDWNSIFHRYYRLSLLSSPRLMEISAHVSRTRAVNYPHDRCAKRWTNTDANARFPFLNLYSKRFFALIIARDDKQGCTKFRARGKIYSFSSGIARLQGLHVHEY